MLNRSSTNRPALRLISPAELEPVVPSVAFCSHCGTRPSTAGSQITPDSRVCGECGLGLILEAGEDIAPHAGDAFLVLDRVLAVCAVSRGAERLLATSEPDAVNRHVSELLMPAGAEEKRGESLVGRGRLGCARRRRHPDHGRPSGQHLRHSSHRSHRRLRPSAGGPARARMIGPGAAAITAQGDRDRGPALCKLPAYRQFLCEFARPVAALAPSAADLDNSA